MKVSVITTVWNTEEWLEQNIQSFLNQTLKDSELILINDCSPDSSAVILNKYKDYPNIKVINNEVNLGPGVSRQIGLDNSCGDYTIFVDSDDWLEPDCLEIMYKEAIDQDADIVSCKTIQHNKYGLNKHKSVNDTFIREDKYNFINNKLIKRYIWDKTFYSPLRFREDINTLFRCLEFSKKTIYIPYAGYNYNLRPNSLTSTPGIAGKSYLYNTLAIIENLQFVEDREINPSPLFKRYYNVRLVRFGNMMAKQLLKDELDKYHSEFQTIQEFLDRFPLPSLEQLFQNNNIKNS